MTKSNVGSLLVFDAAKVTPGSMPTGVQTCVGIVTERGACAFFVLLAYCLLMMTMTMGACCCLAYVCVRFFFSPACAVCFVWRPPRQHPHPPTHSLSLSLSR
jgi:hypothetical protein